MVPIWGYDPMTNDFDRLLKSYDYRLPPELIAQAPAKPRESARLLVYNRRNKKSRFDVFANLGKYLPKNAVLVFNQTKVWPARLSVQKTSGGKAELLYLHHDRTHLQCLSNRPLAPGSTLSLLHGRAKVIELQVARVRKGRYYLRPSFPMGKLPEILQQYGITPLPPYIKHSPLTEKQRREQYQTVFAKTGLSVAAPTASLHFSKPLLNKLKQRGIGIEFVSLDVGLGTFAPLKAENIARHKLHKEYYQIGKAAAGRLQRAKAAGRPIIAVGTTALRTLESAAAGGQFKKIAGGTELFIRPGYKLRFADGLITNFHVPKSSLMMLVAALVGRPKLLQIYKAAIRHSFRFFSFGDGMLVLPR